MFPVRGDSMKLKPYMKKMVISIQDDLLVSDAIEIFLENPIGMLPVVDKDSRLVGIVTLRDIVHLVMPPSFDLMEDLAFLHDLGATEKAKPSLDEINQPIGKLMSPPISAEIDFTLFHAAAIMTKHNIHDLPVIDHDGKLVGLLSHVDVGRGLIAGWHLDNSGKKTED
jgi:CBS domain-containing protein